MSKIATCQVCIFWQPNFQTFRIDSEFETPMHFIKTKIADNILIPTMYLCCCNQTLNNSSSDRRVMTTNMKKHLCLHVLMSRLRRLRCNFLYFDRPEILKEFPEAPRMSCLSQSYHICRLTFCRWRSSPRASVPVSAHLQSFLIDTTHPRAT